MKEFIEAFKALRHASIAFWMCVFAFTFDGMAYFGVLPLMKPFLGQDLGVKPQYASMWVSCFAGGLTVTMLLVGRAETALGIRKSIMLALALALAGRALYASSPFFGGLALVVPALVLYAFGEALVQVICYAGVKQYTTEKTNSMGYALLYAGLNFGAMLMGPISSKVRTAQDVAYQAGTSKMSGFDAVTWFCVAATVVTLVVFSLGMTKKAEANVERRETKEVNAEVSSEDEKSFRESAAPKKVRVPDEEAEAKKKAIKGASPFANARFLFFIFALLPVRTLFAHQWLTMPEYVLRSYPQEVADKMEWIVDSVNPLVIFLGVPTIAAFTKKRHVLSMMMLGSFVSAAAVFLLCFGQHASMLILYFVIFSVGEAIWSSRFLEYAAEIAPEGRVAQYMGVANLPWFTAKMTTGLYSGFILEKFVPKEGPQSPGTMWLIYGCIAMASPILLTVARKWLLAGMPVKADTAAP